MSSENLSIAEAARILKCNTSFVIARLWDGAIQMDLKAPRGPIQVVRRSVEAFNRQHPIDFGQTRTKDGYVCR